MPCVQLAVRANSQEQEECTTASCEANAGSDENSAPTASSLISAPEDAGSTPLIASRPQRGKAHRPQQQLDQPSRQAARGTTPPQQPGRSGTLPTQLGRAGTPTGQAADKHNPGTEQQQACPREPLETAKEEAVLLAGTFCNPHMHDCPWHSTVLFPP